MALSKVQYVDGQTVIAAQNLNDIQDEVIANGNKIGTAQLNTSAQNVSSATNELLYTKARVHDIANPYLDSATYAVGDFCTRMDGTKPTGLYRCKTAINTPEAWTAAHWELVTVGSELKKKYEKPNSGIPKSDLASGVQTSLGKADTALQSVPSTYRTAAAQDVIDAGKETAGLGLTGASVGDLVRVAAVDANGKPTSWRKALLNEIVTNENLLVNGYFVGGGSQQGDGIFPINRRGKTSYSAVGYCVDRWQIRSNENEDYTLTAAGFSIKVGVLYQYVGSPNDLLGKTVTLSVMLDTGVYSATATLPSSFPSSNTLIINKPLDNAANLRLRALSSGNFEVNVSMTSGQTPVLKAIKLELGVEQTLAHLENGAWVLNEIPDYQIELEKCGPVRVGRIPSGKVSIIGDSISTFDGYLYDSYATYYPKSDGDVQDVTDCWWYKAIQNSGAILEVNAAYSGSSATDVRAPRPTFYERVSQEILGNPDTILVALGTNDSAASAPLGDYDFETTYTSLSETTFRTAYIKGMSALKVLYPSATIIALIFMMDDAYKQSIATICDKMDIACVDCSHYTIYSTVHPDANGMSQIASQFSAGTDLSRATEMLGATQVSVLYNGVPTSESFTASAIRVAVWGHMLIVSLEGIIPTARMTSWVTVVSGLPTPIIAPYQAIIANAEMSASEISLTRKLRVRVDSNGSLQIREGDAGQSYTGFYACVV